MSKSGDMAITEVECSNLSQYENEHKWTQQSLDPLFMNDKCNNLGIKDPTHKVSIPPRRNTFDKLARQLTENWGRSDSLENRQETPKRRKCLQWMQYMFPIFAWAPQYKLQYLKSDIIAGLTIASLAIPQGISYARLAGLPPIIGLYSSFVPPLFYAVTGTSKDLAVGTVSVVSLLLRSFLAEEESNPLLHLQLAITATFFAGIFQACLGIFRLGFVLDFLSHATIVGFMAGAAIMISLQQLQGLLEIKNFTTKTDLISVMESVYTSRDEWNWRSVTIGGCFLLWLFIARQISKGKKKLYWVAAIAPLSSVIIATLVVFLSRANKHGVTIVGHLHKGLNPISSNMIFLHGAYVLKGMKIGLVSGLIALTEALAVGRTFSTLKGYRIDGNKEMLSIGIMNIAGSCTSCYITTGSLSRSAVSYNSGGQTAATNIVMSIVVMITLLALTPLFEYTPSAVLGSIIIAAVINLIDIRAMILIWNVDKLDFLALCGALIGVLCVSVEVGLLIAICISLLKVFVHVTRPNISTLGNIRGSSAYRNVKQYTDACPIQGILIIRIEAAIFFSNSNYIRDRILSLISDEENRITRTAGELLRFVILELSPVTSIDTTGVLMFEDLRGSLQKKSLQIALANPGKHIVQKLDAVGFIENLGEEWMFINVAEAVAKCTQQAKPVTTNDHIVDTIV